jgi:hypothetical protein
VGGDLFDYFWRVFIVALLGEVKASDLEAVEEQAGSFGIEVVAGYALQDDADGCLDGGTVFG